MDKHQIEAEILIQKGIIESLKDDSVRRSAEFWKAVETRNRLERELRTQNADHLPAM